MRAAAADPKSAEIKAEIASLYFAAQSSRPRREREGGQGGAGHRREQRRGEPGARLPLRDAVDARSAPDRRVAAGRAERDPAPGTRGGRHDRHRPQSAVHAGPMYLRNGEPQKAVQALSRVVAQNPGNPQARQLLAQRLRRGRRSEGRDRDAAGGRRVRPAPRAGRSRNISSRTAS